MTSRRGVRTVFSTDRRICARCGWPQKDCRCSAKLDEPVPERIVARLRIEKAGRKGKTVTVVEGLPRNPGFLKGLAKELKRACGTGGTVSDDRVEVQGEQRDRIRGLLQAKGWVVKG